MEKEKDLIKEQKIRKNLKRTHRSTSDTIFFIWEIWKRAQASNEEPKLWKQEIKNQTWQIQNAQWAQQA